MNEPMSGDRGERREILKRIVKDLHAGVPVEKLRKTFAKLIKDTSPEEIAGMENALIEEGFPVDEVRRLCDVHVRVFDKALKKVGKPSKVPGHPVYTFLQENKAAKGILKELDKRSKHLRDNDSKMGAVAAFAETFGRFREIEKHYARKEYQLFPALERKGFTGPTKVMWSKHDEIRATIKEAETALHAKDWKTLRERVKSLRDAVKKMIFLEERILYPTASRKLTDVEWAEIKRGESDIGYAWITPSNLWDGEIAKALALAHGEPVPGEAAAGGAASSSPAARAPAGAVGRGAAPGPAAEGVPASGPAAIGLSEGALAPEQLDLMLRALPVDVTFVDENDVVRYYSASEHRIFPRSPGIIGRAVQNCHPPKSVHVVNDIIRSFRDKTKSVAEFWIQSKGQFVHIRYFPVYDAAGAYRGVVEVSQEVSGIRALEGERRILDW
jgi:hypothetical protein